MKVLNNQNLPDRIEPDAILEALIEFRFEHVELPELVLGRLLDVPLWGKYDQVRLPTADIPQSIREMDVSLRYQPVVELRKGDGLRVIKIGSHVVSYHIVGSSYPGWLTFKAEIEDALREVMAKLKSPQLSRIGFRYINILRPDDHCIASLADTNVSLRVGDGEVTESLMVNYVRKLGPNHAVAVKIATPDLVLGTVRPGFSLLCDIDISTSAGTLMSRYDDAVAWVEEAHAWEKVEFFSLLPDDVIKKLIARTERDLNG